MALICTAFLRRWALGLALVGSAGPAWAQKVGIGTPTPTQALDVNGGLRVRAAAGSTAGRLLTLAADGTLVAQPAGYGTGLSSTYGEAAPAYSASPPVSLGTVPTGSHPQEISLNPAGTRAYVVNNDNTLQVYDVSGSGLPVNLGTVPTGKNPYSVSVSPAGTRAYVVNYDDNTLQVYDVSSSGLPVNLGTVPTGKNPYSVSVSPAGTRAYVVNNDNTLQVYDVSSSGLPVSLGTVYIADNYPGTVSVNPAGTRAYLVTASTLQVYDVSGSGLPVSLGTVPTSSFPSPVSVNLAGTRAYVVYNYYNTLQTYVVGGSPQLLGVGAGGAPGQGAQLPGAGRLPAAYGSVGSAGTLYGNTGNLTVSHPAVGTYRLRFTSNPLQSFDLGQAATVATLFGPAPGSVSYATGVGYLDVFTYAPGGAATDRGFMFSVALP